MSEQTQPLAAVLMCVYAGDRPDWLKVALDSIESQTYPRDRFRIYLGVDGPIGPELEQIVESRSRDFWHVCRSQSNITLPRMLNRLIASLRDEEFVFRMDADDICEPNRFETQIGKMRQDESIGIMGCAIREFDLMRKWSRIRSYPESHEELIAKMHLGLPFAHPSVCFRRAALDRLVGYSEESALNQDVELWFRAAFLGIRFANLGEPLLRFRCNRFTLKRRAKHKARNELALYLSGCFRLYGPSYKLIFPLLRFVTRMLPPSFIRFAYDSEIRHRLLGGDSAKKTVKAFAASTAA